MKKIIRSILVAASLAAAAPFAWAGSLGSEVIVSTDPSLGSQFPEVAYYNGVIHVVWVGYASGKLGDIYYSQSADGTSWSAPVNLSGNATGSFGNDHPQVTAGPNGVLVAWNSSNDTGAVYVNRSGDGGATWTGAVARAGAEGDGIYSRITSLFTDSSGRVHIAYYDDRGPPFGVGHIFHRVSCDGTTWGPEKQVTSQAVDGDYDNEQPRLAEAGGKIHLIFRSSRNGNPQGGWAPYSIHMQSGAVSGSGASCAVTWSYPARRIAGGVPVAFSSTYRPEVFGQGNDLHIAWWDNSAGANVWYRKGQPTIAGLGAASKVSGFNVDHLEPGGITSTTATAMGGFQMPPGLASNGTSAYLSYQQNTGQMYGTYEFGPIYLQESATNGASWSAPIQLSGTSQATTPRIALGGSGNTNVAIVYSDIRSGTARVYFRMYHGTITGPSLSLTPNPKDFGSLAVGSTSATAPITVQNVGTSTATLSGTAVTGDFQLGTTTCGATLASGASCVVNVKVTPSALGTRTGTLSVSSNAVDSPGTATLTATGVGSGSFSANVSAVVTGYYENILGRTPDIAGRDFWISEANRVVGLGANVSEAFFALSISFFNSTEYLNKNTTNTQYLTDLYHTFFSREPDTPGLNYWLSQMSGGMDRSAVLINFLFSTEFNNTMTSLFGAPTARAETNMVIDLYRGILGRLPDSAGFTFYLGQIRHAQCQGPSFVATMVNDLAAQIVYSPEYGNIENARPPALRNNYHMSDLYNAFMRRGPDLAGYNFYVSQLNSGGMTRDSIRAGFIQSPEFQNRLTAVMNQGCIPGS